MLEHLTLQNFRNYSKRSFEFSDKTTLIVGPNAAGKTNILEAIYLLATGKSFRVELEKEVIREEQQISRIVGELNSTRLEIDWDDRGRFTKTYKVNGVGKRQVDFVGHLRAVLFSPLDMEIVVNSPSTRRRYLDMVLSQVHKDYRLAAHIYDRAVRQRNRILQGARDQGLGASAIRQRLDYWNGLLIDNGQIIHQRRREYLGFLSNLGNLSEAILLISLHYDHSIISEERLAKYAHEEIAAGATLVGPHRDDFSIQYQVAGSKDKQERDIKLYGSRGEQRLSVFTIKLGELAYIKSMTGEDPLLLLDDIFSELDPVNRHHILTVIPRQQTIMTTTDLRNVYPKYWHQAEVIRL